MTEIKPARPPDTSGTEITRFNALRHGVLSAYTVLPWEDADKYHALVAALVAEHTPQGPTEEHLVEELAGILWRKRRLRQAEAAAHHRGLKQVFDPYQRTAEAALIHLNPDRQGGELSAAIRASTTDTEEDIADLTADEAMTNRALDLLSSRHNDPYEAALSALREDTCDWWAERLARDPKDLEDDEKPASADAYGLRRFLEAQVLPWFENRKRELANRHLIREQAFGEALDPDKLERLGRYEVHLDRKLERMLAMLLRLKDLRRATTPG